MGKAGNSDRIWWRGFGPLGGEQGFQVFQLHLELQANLLRFLGRAERVFEISRRPIGQCQQNQIKNIDNVPNGSHEAPMRDDLHKKAPIPRKAQWVFKLAGRPADRQHPERLHDAAVNALEQAI